jgi:predicted MFS family arabinose efflux permease
VTLFQRPSILIPFFHNFVCFCGFGMIESMLQPHIKNNAKSSQLDVGMTFLILGGHYMVSSVIAGLV